ncbi:FoF1 ATP synthase subunit delta/epsilon [Candidatus Cardinium hertigii]|jgi:F-type H+-transporting ATPase subunit epsilon|uniref:F0F1 ATP synthase subunit epsilon n=1 Tax=Candidatus Cardinium hertigii TaxID=247481 RepID=A0A3N2QAV6_9BACT|nr:F0F1 ATP synthase subunit epsilon [Candidatus Cardinium hertigii]ROT46934.1 F0F1 ATP synthase subunit epsilon [Candidatus Cardinium hertigii]
MHLSIMAFSHGLFKGKVNRVTLPGELGPFQVLANHAPTISSLAAGKITYAVESALSSIEIKSGFASIVHNQITVVCEPLV